MVKAERKNFSARLLYFQIFLGLVTVLMVCRLFYISVLKHATYMAQAESQHNFSETLPPTRGDISVQDYSSGQTYTVATNIKKDLVYAIPNEVKDPVSEASKLAVILNGDPKDIETKISDTTKHYVVIAHQLTDVQSAAVKSAALPGISTDPEGFRFYPEGEFLAQVLGYVGYTANSDTKTGVYGIEQYFNGILAGQQGSIKTEADLHGNWITGSSREMVPEKDGSNLLLTIDRSIEFKAESVLKQTVQQHSADSGSVIVMDVKTGAILAMANYPDFDPNNYGSAASPSDYVNSSTMRPYEPGSTMKAITMATALNLNVVNPQTTYVDAGFVEVAGYKIKNAESTPFGEQTMIQLLDKSLNTGAIFVENKIGNQDFLQSLKNFGFGQATNIELPELLGDIATLNNDSEINFDTASFGQGITVTPLQMVAAYGALANGGKLMQPYIIASVTDDTGKTITTQPKEVRQAISAQAAQQISGMLVDVVENGLGKHASVKGYWIAGKTGTAQVAEKGVYVPNDNIGSFIGYAPVEDPKFVMIVKIDHPRDVSFAETTTAPAWGEIAQFILNYYHIAPTRK